MPDLGLSVTDLGLSVDVVDLGRSWVPDLDLSVSLFLAMLPKSICAQKIYSTTMNLLTLDIFIKHLPAPNGDVLTPGESSRLQLAITELFVDNYSTLDLLKFLSRFLTQQTYDEIIEERNIEHQCGYLICDKSPTQQVRRSSEVDSRFQIYNRKPTMILPNTYRSQYCCKDHYQASIFYRNQLSNESVFARKDILMVSPFGREGFYETAITGLEEVLEKHRELKELGKSISEVISMMSGLSVGEGQEELVKLIEDFEIVEKDAEYETDERSFGGYVV